MGILSIITSVAFFLPLIILGIRKLMHDKLLIWFAVFWAWAGLINIIFEGDYVSAGRVILVLQRVYNLFDVPILLLILFKTTYIEEVRNSIKKVILPFFVIETAAIAIAGFESPVESILVALGVLLALYYFFLIILLHMKGI
ncbi:MAG: hypothetical protein J0H29_17620, partial [Sphingobacteriales bacterium]|nr:hypothetical protein [Sphingobacteriales bacterium]